MTTATPRIVPVILSGGAGTRLWPLSTDQHPKQFLPLTGAQSLYHAALNRVADGTRFTAPMVVAAARHAGLCRAGLADDATLILEPVARNTAPAIAMAALAAQSQYGNDAVLLVMPSDHVIADPAAFHAAVATGLAAAQAGWLVTFGIRPTAPETGYGYLALGEPLTDAPGAYAVARFVEKPPLADATAMLADGQHLWNAGIFLFRADALLAEMAAQVPAMANAARTAMTAAARDGQQITPDATALTNCPSESIDYAVMEHAGRVATVPMAPGWSDVGSWDALADLAASDGAGNALQGRVTALDCAGVHIVSDGPQIAALGLTDLIVVASGDKLLILPRGRSQEVKALLAAMAKDADD